MSILKFAAVILALTSALQAAEIADCGGVAGWERDGPMRTFGADNLFEYIDGEANSYLLYGFIRMQNITCKSGDDSIVIDVSEMADADAAYGIFSGRRNPGRPVAKFGMGGQIQPQSAIFCKGKYYLELTAKSDKDNTTSLQAFVTELEKHVTGRTDPPTALAWFPTGKLVSIQMIPQDVLGLSLLRRGYVAQYESGKAFVVVEQSGESAAAVMKMLRERIGRTTSTKVADEAFLASDRYLGGLCFFRKGRYLGGFANLPQAEAAIGMASALAARIP